MIRTLVVMVDRMPPARDMSRGLLVCRHMWIQVLKTLVKFVNMGIWVLLLL